ncbi:hypothetical protein D3C76_1063870 [compost metagenome]
MGGKGHIPQIQMDTQLLRVFLGEFQGLLIQAAGDFIGIGIVVAVAGGMGQKLADNLPAFEIPVQSLQQLLHGDSAVLKHQLADGRQGIHHRTVADKFEVAQVNAAFDVVGMQILVVFQAQLMKRRAQRCGKMALPQPDNGMLLHEGMAQEVGLLGQVGMEEGFPVGKLCRLRRFQTDSLLPVQPHPAAVQGHLQGCGKVDVGAGTGIGIPVGHAAFRTAGYGIVVSLLEGRPFGQQKGNHLFVIDQLREAGALLDGFGNFV